MHFYAVHYFLCVANFAVLILRALVGLSPYSEVLQRLSSGFWIGVDLWLKAMRQAKKYLSYNRFLKFSCGWQTFCNHDILTARYYAMARISMFKIIRCDNFQVFVKCRLCDVAEWHKYMCYFVYYDRWLCSHTAEICIFSKNYLCRVKRTLTPNVNSFIYTSAALMYTGSLS